jgi:hypothetical protein
MYTREESSLIRQHFWTRFGQYMSLHLSSEGEKVNWVNYKTGIKHLAFRMDVGKDEAVIRIEINHPDEGVQALFFEQMEELKALFHDQIGEVWIWQLHARDANGRVVSWIEKRLPGVNVFREEDWPLIIGFFKPRIIALDAFWADAQHTFEPLK